MNKNRMEHVRKLLILVMNHLFFILTALTLTGLTGHRDAHILLWASLIIVPFIFYFVHLYKPVLLHPKAFVPLVGFYLLVESFHTQNNWQTYYLLATLLYLLCYILYYFLSQYTDYITLNNFSASNIPEKEIFHSGLKRTGIFTLICLLLVSPLVASEWFAGIIAKTREIFLSLAKWFIFWLQTLDVEELEKNSNQASGSIYESLHALDNNEKMYQFWTALEKILPLIMVVLILIGIVFLARLVYRLLRQLFLKQREQNDSEFLSNHDLREHCDIDKIRDKNASIFSFADNRMKIRRLYRKRILKSQTELIGNQDVKELEYMTAKECCDKLAANNLKQVYEKAKYSAEEITSDDIRLAKNSE